MGSGLILLLIVGAWLAVLVPMALRSQDSGSSQSSVERFNDAMRVLARREPDSRAEHDGDASSGADAARSRPSTDGRLEPLEYDDDQPGLMRAGLVRLRALGSVRVPWSAGSGAVPGRRRTVPHPDAAGSAPAGSRGSAAVPGSRGSGATRRRRLLIGLLALSLGTLVAGLVGPPALLGVHVVVDVLLISLVVHLRRQAVAHTQARRAAARRRDVPAARPTPAPRASAGSVRVTAGSLPTTETPIAGTPIAGTPIAETSVAETSGSAETAGGADEPITASSTAVRYEDPLPPPRPAPAAAIGEAWQPVPVPVPTYVTAPVVARRIVDLTRPGAWSDAERQEAERRSGAADVRGELDHVLDRRRAAGEW